jgi:hypothetical protein
MAAVLACGPGAVLSHRSAGALWGLPIGDNGLSHVTAPTAHTRRRVDVHRASLDPRDHTVRHGIPVTTLARTLADLAHSLDDASYHRAVKEAQFRKLFDDARIRDALTRRPAARLKRYLGDHHPHAVGARGCVYPSLPKALHPGTTDAVRHQAARRLHLARPAPDRRGGRLRGARHARRLPGRPDDHERAPPRRLPRPALHLRRRRAPAGSRRGAGAPCGAPLTTEFNDIS